MAVALFHLWNDDTQEILASTFARNHDEAACQLLTTLAKQAHREGMTDAHEAVMREWDGGILTVTDDTNMPVA